MSCTAQVQCDDGTYYDIEGEGGNMPAASPMAPARA